MPSSPPHPSRKDGWVSHGIGTPRSADRWKVVGFSTVGTFHRSAGHGLWESSALFDLSREERDGSTRILVFPTHLTETWAWLRLWDRSKEDTAVGSGCGFFNLSFEIGTVTNFSFGRWWRLFVNLHHVPSEKIFKSVANFFKCFHLVWWACSALFALLLGRIGTVHLGFLVLPTYFTETWAWLRLWDRSNEDTAVGSRSGF